MFKLAARLDANHGFSVEVLDIDPSFSLGDLKAKAEAIRRGLREAGLWEANRLLPRPADFLRVAVVSPAGAAGLGDFRSTAEALARAGLVEFAFREAAFQTRDLDEEACIARDTPPTAVTTEPDQEARRQHRPVREETAASPGAVTVWADNLRAGAMRTAPTPLPCHGVAPGGARDRIRNPRCKIRLGALSSGQRIPEEGGFVQDQAVRVTGLWH